MFEIFCGLSSDSLEDAALRLGQDREFITRLVEWCAVDEHPGVKGESMNKLGG